jgi:hypothetical protein
LETEKFKLKDLFYGVIIPIVIVILIFLLAVYVNPNGQYHVFGLTGITGTIGVILTQGLAQMIILAVPMILGLLWNKWAGGAAGFIMGGMYYVASAGVFTGYYATAGGYNFFGDISLLAWIVNAAVIGYMAGALTNKSTNFKRMLGAGLTAALIVATIQAYLNYTVALTVSRNMAIGQWNDTSVLGVAGLYGFILAFVPSIALGIIVPVIAKVMTWYGLQPMRH